MERTLFGQLIAGNKIYSYDPFVEKITEHEIETVTGKSEQYGIVEFATDHGYPIIFQSDKSEYIGDEDEEKYFTTKEALDKYIKTIKN